MRVQFTTLAVTYAFRLYCDSVYGYSVLKKSLAGMGNSLVV